MPRTRSTLVRIAAIAAVSAGLIFGSATAASAFGPADITVTPETTGENQSTALSVVCPLTSVSARLTWTGIDGGAPIVYGPFSTPLDVAGELTETYFLEGFFDRDTDATFALECLDAGALVTGTDSTVHHLPTTGAVSSAAASRPVNQDIVVTGNCGTAVSITSLTISAYQEPADTLIAGFPIVVPYTNAADYSVNLGTGTALGVPVDDTVLVSVQCQSSAPATHFTSNRITLTLMAAAVAAAAPALAATGVDATGTLIAAGSLAALGGALLLMRRRAVRAL